MACLRELVGYCDGIGGSLVIPSEARNLLWAVSRYKQREEVNLRMAPVFALYSPSLCAKLAHVGLR